MDLSVSRWCLVCLPRKKLLDAGRDDSDGVLYRGRHGTRGPGRHTSVSNPYESNGTSIRTATV